VTDGSERGRMVKTQNADTPTPSAPTRSATPSETSNHRSARPLDRRAGFSRGERAIACYYTDGDDTDGSLERAQVARPGRRQHEASRAAAAPQRGAACRVRRIRPNRR